MYFKVVKSDRNSKGCTLHRAFKSVRSGVLHAFRAVDSQPTTSTTQISISIVFSPLQSALGVIFFPIDVLYLSRAFLRPAAVL
jgi:hypothetical protein